MVCCRVHCATVVGATSGDSFLDSMIYFWITRQFWLLWLIFSLLLTSSSLIMINSNKMLDFYSTTSLIKLTIRNIYKLINTHIQQCRSFGQSPGPDIKPLYITQEFYVKFVISVLHKPQHLVCPEVEIYFLGSLQQALLLISQFQMHKIQIKQWNTGLYEKASIHLLSFYDLQAEIPSQPRGSVHTHLFLDYPGEPLPEEIFWTLWFKGRYQRQTQRQSDWASLRPD